MSDVEQPTATRASQVRRRDVLRGAATLMAGSMALASTTAARAQTDDPALDTVVVTDLRGYGDSGNVQGSRDHNEYSKRTMALDQVEVMRHYGFERFSVVGHDRGARVTHRLALDHAQRIDRAALCDIMPTHYLLSRVDNAFAEGAYHWFFFARPAPFPETVISNSLELFVGREDQTLGAEYRRVFRLPGTLHAMCEDYRAGGSIDFEHDGADLDKNAVWGERAANVSGRQMPGGHSFQESHPAETVAELRAFLAG